jgi:benzoyl-CoA reductase/2-hydroxyglutaryl-CoA dehydratase subunit BcrC/BadD/HgdB
VFVNAQEPTKTVVYTCPYVPAEWIAAHGLRPRRLIPLPIESACAIPRLEGLCPYARAFANDAVADGQADGIIVTTLCDQMRRVFELLTRRTDAPAFLLNVPSTWQTVAARKLYLDELKRLGRFLVHLGGHEPGKEELARTMLDHESARHQALGCAPHTNVSRASCPRSEGGTPSARAPHTLSPAAAGPGIPIAVVGGPLMQRDRVLFDVIEHCGGHLVLDATETGLRGLCRLFDRRYLQDDPLMELAQAYFEIPDASRRPNSRLYEWLQEELVETGAQGIIFHHYLWCDAWRAELARLKEWAPLPVLGLDSDGHGPTDMARLQSRVRAFLETLQ